MKKMTKMIKMIQDENEDEDNDSDNVNEADVSSSPLPFFPSQTPSMQCLLACLLVHRRWDPIGR